MASEKLARLVGDAAAEEFETMCGAVLAEASARMHNPIDGNAVCIPATDRLRVAAAEFLGACGLLWRGDGRRRDATYTISELGQSAAERVTRKFMDQIHGRA